MSDPAAFFGTVAQVSASAFAIVAALFTQRLGEHRPDIEHEHDEVDHQVRRARELVASCATFLGKRDQDLLLGRRVAERLGGGPPAR